MLHESAMTAEELASALEIGLLLARQAAGRDESIIAVGEMGIGNTTAASALAAALTGQPIKFVTGRGAGLTDIACAHKCSVLSKVLERHRILSKDPGAASSDPIETLRSLGGLEIAAMTGMMLGAASHGMAVVADGFISTAAAAIAFALAPAVRPYLFAGHQSEEPGHRVLLAHLRLKPILRLNMRLGEGTGAVLALPILESALALYDEMATFASAGVDGRRLELARERASRFHGDRNRSCSFRCLFPAGRCRAWVRGGTAAPAYGHSPKSVAFSMRGHPLPGTCHRALHEDGFADAADGFGGGRDREHTLRTLRDSRIGSYGATVQLTEVAVLCCGAWGR
jgi:hypothetical protein